MTTRFAQIATSHLFLICDGKILLSRRSNTGFRDGEYSVPAGHVEPNETARQSAVRETKEEIGVDVVPDELEMVHVMHRYENDHRIDFFWLARNWHGEPMILEPSKCDDLAWFPVDAIPENTVPYIRQAISCYLHGTVYSEMYWP